MSTPCDWVDSRLEDLLTGDPEVRKAVDAHTRTCVDCRRQVEAYEEVDRRVGSYFATRMEHARRAPIRTQRRLLAAAATAAAALLVAWIVSSRIPLAPTDHPSVVSAPESLLDDGELALAKPSEGAKPSEDRAAHSAASAPDDLASLPDASFYVVDAAGYAHTLDDFRDQVVVLGVFDDTGTGADDFLRAYSATPPRADVQFLAVGLDEGAGRAVSGIPMMVNRGSTLLGVGAGEFAILSRDGVVERRGRLATEADGDSLETIRAGLGALGIIAE